MELDIIKGKKVAELREIAAALKIPGAAAMKKAEIVALLTKMHEEAEAQAAGEAAEAQAASPEKPAAKRRGRKKAAEKEAEAAEPAEKKAPAGQTEKKDAALEVIELTGTEGPEAAKAPERKPAGRPRKKAAEAAREHGASRAVIHLIKWKDILEDVEEALDHTKRVGDMIRGVVMKYS